MLKKLLAALQGLVKRDKAIAVGVLLQAAVALAGALHYKLNGPEVAIVSTLINVGVGYFLAAHFAAKLAAARASKDA